MHRLTWMGGILLSLCAILTLAAAGCYEVKPRSARKAAANKAHTHGEWWCAEHGVPEEECGLCSAKLAAEFKQKGDWCKEHDRPDSQCFICHPEHEAKYAALYEAKYGKKPPKPEGEEPAKQEKEDKPKPSEKG